MGAEAAASPATPLSPAWDGFLAEYLAHLSIERGLADNTVTAYRRDLGRYASFAMSRGLAEPDQISTTDISEFSRSLAEAGLRPSTITRMVVAVRGLHRFGVAEQVTSKDPAADVSPPAVGSRLPKALDLDQVMALLSSPDTTTVTGLRDQALLELLYGTGARISELCALDVDDAHGVLADADAGLRLLGKGSKQRVVPVGSHARNALDAWLIRGRPAWAGLGRVATPALFLNSRGGRLSRQSGWQVLARAAAIADLGIAISPHTLRHSFATHLLDGGADVRVVQELLGHASVTTTQIYTLVTAEHLRSVYLSAHPRAY